jgi:hypothetical protein
VRVLKSGCALSFSRKLERWHPKVIDRIQFGDLTMS